MIEEQSTEEEKIRHRFLLSSICENERIFIYTYAYGALSIFIYLVSKELEHGYLLSITNTLGLASLYMWYKTNPWLQIQEIKRCLNDNESEEITEQYKSYKIKAKKYGGASVVFMFIAICYVALKY